MLLDDTFFCVKIFYLDMKELYHQFSLDTPPRGQVSTLLLLRVAQKIVGVGLVFGNGRSTIHAP